MLLMFHGLVCSLTVQPALGTALMLGYIPLRQYRACGGCLPSGSIIIHMSLHHLAVITQPSGIPIVSPVLFMQL